MLSVESSRVTPALACSPKFTFQILTAGVCPLSMWCTSREECCNGVRLQTARKREFCANPFIGALTLLSFLHTSFFPYKQQTRVPLANNFFTAVSLSVLEKKKKSKKQLQGETEIKP